MQAAVDNNSDLEDVLHDHCGVAWIRLRRPFDFYREKYGDGDFLVNLMHLLMLRQRNRGQDACGTATAYHFQDRFEQEYLFKDKMISPNPVPDWYNMMTKNNDDGSRIADDRRGIVMIGHTLYSTILKGVDYRYVHPVEKESRWPSRRLVIAMNGNFANNEEQREFLRDIGKHPDTKSDMITLVEQMGHFLNREYERLRSQGHKGEELCHGIDMFKVMHETSKLVHGAYTIVGIVGNGDSFIARDPNAIRPAHYFINDELVIGASEPSAIASSLIPLNIDVSDIKELGPGEMILVKSSGDIKTGQFTKKRGYNLCQFETPYFARVNNAGIYNDRKAEGASLAEKVVEKIPNIDQAIISYVPETSESAAIGLCKAVKRLRASSIVDRILDMAEKGKLSRKKLLQMVGSNPEYELTLTKDAKLRTFIAQPGIRKGLVASAYDVVYDMIKEFSHRPLILVEDSIVKGTTLEVNVCGTLARAGATDIYVVSSCPQIRYTCCYGIEMSNLKEFVAFRAAIDLLREKGMLDWLEEIGEVARFQDKKISDNRHYKPKRNLVQEIYAQSKYDEVSDRIGRLITPKNIPGWDGRVQVIYPTPEMHKVSIGHGRDLCMACLDGNYPEPGGFRVLNKALVNFFDKKNDIAY